MSSVSVTTPRALKANTTSGRGGRPQARTNPHRLRVSGTPEPPCPSTSTTTESVLPPRTRAPAPTRDPPVRVPPEPVASPSTSSRLRRAWLGPRTCLRPRPAAPASAGNRRSHGPTRVVVHEVAHDRGSGARAHPRERPRASAPAHRKASATRVCPSVGASRRACWSEARSAPTPTGPRAVPETRPRTSRRSERRRALSIRTPSSHARSSTRSRPPPTRSPAARHAASSARTSPCVQSTPAPPTLGWATALAASRSAGRDVCTRALPPEAASPGERPDAPRASRRASEDGRSARGAHDRRLPPPWPPSPEPYGSVRWDAWRASSRRPRVAPAPSYGRPGADPAAPHGGRRPTPPRAPPAAPRPRPPTRHQHTHAAADTAPSPASVANRTQSPLNTTPTPGPRSPLRHHRGPVGAQHRRIAPPTPPTCGFAGNSETATNWTSPPVLGRQPPSDRLRLRLRVARRQATRGVDQRSPPRRPTFGPAQGRAAATPDLEDVLTPDRVSTTTNVRAPPYGAVSVSSTPASRSGP